jgi:hypothetical protein
MVTMLATIDILEWLATLFLAVEAIKLRNLEALRYKLEGIFNAGDLLFTDKGKFRSVSGFASLIAGFLMSTWLLKAFNYEPSGILDGLERFAFSWNIAIGIVIYLCGAVLIGCVMGAVGVAVVISPFVFIMLMMTTLLAIERYTASGVIGIVGFSLFSLATLIKFVT